MKRYLYKDLYNLEDQHWWHINKRTLAESLLKKYLKNKKLKILDVGCGTGKNLEFFQSLGQTWGIDFSKDAIKFCKKRGLKNVYQADARNLPFKKNSFNLVLLFDVLEHVDENQTLEQINKVLKKNGYLLITVPAFPFLWSKWDEVLHHKRRYTDKTLTESLIRNDFKTVKISYIYSFLVIPSLIIRQLKKLIFKKQYPSDFKLSTPLINKFMLGLSKAESEIILQYFVPFGTSLICLAQKNET